MPPERRPSTDAIVRCFYSKSRNVTIWLPVDNLLISRVFYHQEYLETCPESSEIDAKSI
jgi:hypothetical protein